MRQLELKMTRGELEALYMFVNNYIKAVETGRHSALKWFILDEFETLQNHLSKKLEKDKETYKITFTLAFCFIFQEKISSNLDWFRDTNLHYEYALFIDITKHITDFFNTLE